MPLNRPALPIGHDPRSVHQARQWVIQALADIGRSELKEAGELGVSELVTNAVLHAAAPISVRVRGTWEHPRIEVRDGTTDPPILPDPDSLDLQSMESPDFDLDDLLVTFGRGLDIVSRCADAWGAAIEEAGKIVWFAPTSVTREQGVQGTITGLTDQHDRGPGPDAVPYRLLGAPMQDLVDFDRHYRELRREVRLLALAHEGEYPLARNLSQLFGKLQRELDEGLEGEQVRAAQAAGLEKVDLTVWVTPESAANMGQFVELLDFADEFLRHERMLSLARSPAQQRFQTWFLTEFVRQRDGLDPLPYNHPLRLV